jgi:hypothetical protein
MGNPDSECLVQLGRMQINENVMYFEASKEKCVDLFTRVSERFNIQQFMTFGIKLTAFLPMDSPNGASEFLQEFAFGLGQREWSLLGPGSRGAGMRVVLHQDGIVDVKIEPFFNEPSQLYVEVDVQHPEPFSTLANVGPWMDQAYQFLFGNVKDFLIAMSRRGV